MSSARGLLLVAALAACQKPGARLEALHLEATHPELVLLRCRTSGLHGRLHYAWQLPTGVRAFGMPSPVDEPALIVQVAETVKTAAVVECGVTGDGDVKASALLGLGPSQVTGAKAAGAQLTVDGTGFTAKRDGDDAVWLVPARGRAVRADHACAGASWSENKIVACLPAMRPAPYQVRVESAGRLALGPAVTLGAP